MSALAYQQTQVMTASPGQLLVLLLDAGARNMLSAASAFDDDNREEAHKHLRKASDIVWELQRTLDAKQAPELCEHLLEVYTQVSARLLDAMLKNDPGPARSAHELFHPLLEAYRDVVDAEEDRLTLGGAR